MAETAEAAECADAAETTEAAEIELDCEESAEGPAPAESADATSIVEARCFPFSIEW